MSYRIEINGWGPGDREGADAPAAAEALQAFLQELAHLDHYVTKATVNGEPVKENAAAPPATPAAA